MDTTAVMNQNKSKKAAIGLEQMMAQTYVQNDTSKEEDDKKDDDDEDNKDDRMSEPEEVRKEESSVSQPSDAESTGNNAGVNPAPQGSQPPGALARSPPAKTVVGADA